MRNICLKFKHLFFLALEAISFSGADIDKMHLGEHLCESIVNFKPVVY